MRVSLTSPNHAQVGASLLVNAYRSHRRIPARSSAGRIAAAHTAEAPHPGSHMGFLGRSQCCSCCTAERPCQSMQPLHHSKQRCVLIQMQ